MRNEVVATKHHASVAVVGLVILLFYDVSVFVIQEMFF